MIWSILRWLGQVSRRIHVRVILFAVLNVLALAIAALLGPVIPAGLGDLIGADAVDRILQIIATSMLAVVTFSLTVMVTAFARSEQQWTPRSHILLREDTRTHSVLATFLGAYIYALIAIIMRSADLFGEKEVVILFGMTVLVVVLIVMTMIGWIVHLEGLGSLPQMARDLEARAVKAVRQAALQPCQGANPLTDGTELPGNAQAVTAKTAGYVQQIFEGALQDMAQRIDARFYITVPVGRFVQAGEVIALLEGGKAGPQDIAAIRAAIPIDDVRGFDMDPVFGVTVLAEIATRALSPGINDPGTAIDIVYRLSHVMLSGGCGAETDGPTHDRLWIRPIAPAMLFEAGFDPVARCAGDAVEVHLAIQRALASVAAGCTGSMAEAARRAADVQGQRGLRLLSDQHDRARLEAVLLSSVDGS